MDVHESSVLSARMTDPFGRSGYGLRQSATSGDDPTAVRHDPATRRTEDASIEYGHTMKLLNHNHLLGLLLTGFVSYASGATPPVVQKADAPLLNLRLPAEASSSQPSDRARWQQTARPPTTVNQFPYGSGYETRQRSRSELSGHTGGRTGAGRGR